MVTMSDVAKRAGVSIPTVSFVLNNKQSRQTISDATKARVWQAIDDLGYRRNHAAKTTRTGLFGCAALILSTSRSRSYLPEALLDGIYQELEAQGMHLVITRLSDAKLTDPSYVPGILRECMADGLLIDYINDFPPQMAELIESRNIPAVWLNVRRERDCVFPDDFQAGYDATRHLIAAGHKRIDYWELANSPHFSIDDRRSGYEKAMREAELTPRVLDLDTTSPYIRQEEQLRWALENDRPTAVLAYGSSVLTPLYLVALKMGIRVPHDLSLSMMHPEPFNALNIDITTWRIPFKEMGSLAVKALQHRIKNPEVETPPHVLPFDFIEGETVLKVKSL